MILAIDIGNTNIVLGCMEHDRILVEARMATDLLKTLTSTAWNSKIF